MELGDEALNGCFLHLTDKVLFFSLEEDSQVKGSSIFALDGLLDSLICELTGKKS